MSWYQPHVDIVGVLAEKNYTCDSEMLTPQKEILCMCRRVDGLVRVNSLDPSQTQNHFALAFTENDVVFFAFHHPQPSQQTIKILTFNSKNTMTDFIVVDQDGSSSGYVEPKKDCPHLDAVQQPTQSTLDSKCLGRLIYKDTN